MSVDLRAVIAGRGSDDVLPACRLDGFGVETFGREAIAALFARYPGAGNEWLAASSPTAAALVGFAADGPALFADLAAGGIVRLWRLGPVVDLPPPPRTVSVAADDDLHQSRGSVLFEPADHPGLGSDGAAVVVAAAGLAAAADLGLTEPPLRTRVFVRRAFSDGETHVALFGLSVLANGARRQPLAFNMLAYASAGAPLRLVVDRAGLAAAQAQPWAPYL